jgi:hypothetical protein
MELKQILTMIKERRFAPRYSCDFPVVMEIDNNHYEFAACNISITGMSLQFSLPVKQELSSLGVRLDAGDRLGILLPARKHELPSVLSACQVQYVRRLSQESYLMGCQFVDPDLTARQVIDELVRQLASL